MDLWNHINSSSLNDFWFWNAMSHEFLCDFLACVINMISFESSIVMKQYIVQDDGISYYYIWNTIDNFEMKNENCFFAKLY